MAVNDDYMLNKPTAPPAWREALNLNVMPVVINTAASLESGVERLAVTTRAHKATSLLTALALGFVLTRTARHITAA